MMTLEQSRELTNKIVNALKGSYGPQVKFGCVLVAKLKEDEQGNKLSLIPENLAEHEQFYALCMIGLDSFGNVAQLEPLALALNDPKQFLVDYAVAPVSIQQAQKAQESQRRILLPSDVGMMPGAVLPPKNGD